VEVSLKGCESGVGSDTLGARARGFCVEPARGVVRKYWVIALGRC